MRSTRSLASDHRCPLPERPAFDRVSYEAGGRGSFGWLCRPASWICQRCGRGWAWGRRVIEGGSAAGWIRAGELDSTYLRRAWDCDRRAVGLPLFSRERRKLRREARDHRIYASWLGDV